LLDKTLNFRISSPMLDYIDRRRGTKSRGAWVRDLIRADANRSITR
jgi:hypothetical protein